jgi:hypothetical protein
MRKKRGHYSAVGGFRTNEVSSSSGNEDWLAANLHARRCRLFRAVSSSSLQTRAKPQIYPMFFSSELKFGSAEARVRLGQTR